MPADRGELISLPLSVMDQPSSEPNAGEIIPRSPAVVAFLDAGGVHLSCPPDQTAPAYNNGGRDPPEFTNRSEPITLAKRALVLTAETAAAIILLPVTGFTSAAQILLLDLTAGLTILAYASCVCAVWLSKTNPRIAGLMGEMSTACAGVSFLITMGLLLPPKLIWIVVLNCLVLFSVFASRFIN